MAAVKGRSGPLRKNFKSTYKAFSYYVNRGLTILVGTDVGDEINTYSRSTVIFSPHLPAIDLHSLRYEQIVSGDRTDPKAIGSDDLANLCLFHRGVSVAQANIHVLTRHDDITTMYKTVPMMQLFRRGLDRVDLHQWVAENASAPVGVYAEVLPVMKKDNRSVQFIVRDPCIYMMDEHDAISLSLAYTSQGLR